MPNYETSGSDSNFTYQLWYSQGSAGWALDGIQILKFSQPIMPMQKIDGIYPIEALAVAHGIGWCEIFIQQLQKESGVVAA
ncbi:MULTISPECIES: hypothetical protein [unclassified Herbaspirillum]|uniref:hypothetical protein n=1 Tax=unclassified Herbaspirillum TaxID=2624150 RepID=UPI0011519214|nr:MULTISPECIES: hypothetical protein [unclassified Herbaspirillum]MBB5391975.1 hypothetical protein [Herbaspirillum sp. SJZ102]TQK13435.1 hypothetical protein FB599_0851 [Herbaspirillum sp. SJZ130]TQK15439.1 hypothetical protein FB598_0789 [Herbaspirillum sp. SJZ106]TWC71334.1 hypothetical protein FB597_101304 [Herbaspirillum sp. SJZ099]